MQLLQLFQDCIAHLRGARCRHSLGLDIRGAKPAGKDGRPYYGANGPNRTYQQGPNTRVYITTRSWLDAGTEVLPGDRKFQDYAFPSPYGYPSFARENNNRPIDRQPLNPPSDLGGFPRNLLDW